MFHLKLKCFTHVTGGYSPYTYLWNTSSSSNPIGVTGGIYTVAITDSVGCEKTISDTITQPSPIIGSFSSNTIKCNGDTVSLLVNVTGSYSPYTYLWNTTATSNVIHGISAGIYSVKILDSVGCEKTISDTIKQPLPIAASFSANTIKCNGDTASLSVNVSGGYSPYVYLWNTTSTSNTIHGAAGGIYTVAITDSAGCNKTKSDTLTQPSLLNVTIVKSICNTESPAFIKINATGGSQPYTYIWNTTPIQTTDSVGNLVPGDYIVTITDGNLCTRTIYDTVFFNFQNLETVNIFTPNGDGRNDFFFPFSYENNSLSSLISSIDSYELNIYDRWGKNIFYSNKPNDTWVGKEVNGNLCSNGVYYWIVIINSKCKNSGKQTFKGFVHLGE